MDNIKRCLDRFDIKYQKKNGVYLLEDSDEYGNNYKIAVESDEFLYYCYTYYLPLSGKTAVPNLDTILLERNSEYTIASYQKNENNQYEIRASLSATFFDCTHLVTALEEIREMVGRRVRDILDPDP